MREPVPRRLRGIQGQVSRDLQRTAVDHAADLLLRAGVDTRGDLVTSVGGQRQAIGPLMFVDLPASATSKLKFGNVAGATKFIPWREGSLMGLGLSLDIVTAGEALTFQVLKNATVIDTVVIALGVKKREKLWDKDLFTFLPEDEIEVQAVTSAAWTATTADVVAWLEPEM